MMLVLSDDRGPWSYQSFHSWLYISTLRLKGDRWCCLYTKCVYVWVKIIVRQNVDGRYVHREICSFPFDICHPGIVGGGSCWSLHFVVSIQYPVVVLVRLIWIIDGRLSSQHSIILVCLLSRLMRFWTTIILWRCLLVHVRVHVYVFQHGLPTHRKASKVSQDFF